MDVTMTQLSNDTPTPQMDYEPLSREPPKDERSFGSPVPVYYDEPSPIYYDPPPSAAPVEPKIENEFNIDKQTMILLLAAFVVGVLLGSLRRPIILKH